MQTVSNSFSRVIILILSIVNRIYLSLFWLQLCAESAVG
jgi:hypothetical protein